MNDEKPLIFRYFHCMKVCLVRFLILFLASIPVFAVMGGLPKSDNVQGIISLGLFAGWGVVFAILSYKRRIQYGNVSRSFISELPEDKKFLLAAEIKRILKRNRSELIAESLVFCTWILFFIIPLTLGTPEVFVQDLNNPVIRNLVSVFVCVVTFTILLWLFLAPFLIINIGVWVKVEKKWLRDHIELVTKNKNEAEQTDNYYNKY